MMMQCFKLICKYLQLIVLILAQPISSQSNLQLRYFDCHMEASILNQSSIKINFGGEIHKSENHPLHLSFLLDFFSAEQQAKRKQLEENLKIQVPHSALVLQLVVGGDSAEAVSKLNSSNMIKGINESSKSATHFYSYGNKVVIIVSGEGQQLSSFFKSQQENYAHLKNQLNESHRIQLNITSSNNLSQISNLIKEKKSFTYGWLESLQLHFGFQKSPATEKIIIAILEKTFGAGNKANLFKSFKQLNLQLNCSSSRVLDDFPTIKLRPVVTNPINQLVAILNQAKIEAAHLSVLNPTIFLKGKFQVQGINDLLSILFD